MSIRYVLFDLDGTLLPMDQDDFIKAYFGRLVQRLAPMGYDPEKLIKSIWGGTAAMVKNDGSKSNEVRFWKYFATIFGEDSRKDEPEFDAFYRTDFQAVRQVCGFDSRAAKVIQMVKDKGLTPVLATNPIFPAVATESRMRWAGLKQEDFALYTTYENSTHCKPNPAYYQDILSHLHAAPEECVMVGNDVTEDMVAQTLGMKVFLLTACLINKENKDISCYPNGDFDALMDYIQSM